MNTTGIASTKQDILQLLLKQGRATAQELAKELAISPQAIRRHLGELEAEGLILHESDRLSMGRPQHIYQLSRQGKEKFPNRYGEFALSFLDTLAETVGEEQVGKVLEKQWQKKVEEYRDRLGNGNLKARMDKLVELRQAEGYMAELHRVEDTTEQYILTEHNCAISDVAESYPTVCGHELEMFVVLFPDCKVDRTNWINNGEHRCGYLIRMQDKN
jgi:DeoR family transcriptional regulator, suf operon transcriptional repressor